MLCQGWLPLTASVITGSMIAIVAVVYDESGLVEQVIAVINHVGDSSVRGFWL